MSAVPALQELIDARSVWHAGRSARTKAEAEPTGHAALDALLPSGGWPRNALSELLIPHDGVGELALLLPMLCAVARRGGRIVLVAPRFVFRRTNFVELMLPLMSRQLLQRALPLFAGTDAFDAPASSDVAAIFAELPLSASTGAAVPEKHSTSDRHDAAVRRPNFLKNFLFIVISP